MDYQNTRRWLKRRRREKRIKAGKNRHRNCPMTDARRATHAANKAKRSSGIAERIVNLALWWRRSK